jgi:hypothetical protein
MGMSYLEKMEEVRMKQPRIGLLAVRCENSPYVSYSGNLKNCYLLSGSEFDEDCFYSFWLYDSKDCSECDYCDKCTLCYDCVDCQGAYNTNHSQDSVNCTDCEYLYDCIGCNKCFGCVGLRRQKYMVFNKQVLEEEYAKTVESLKQIATGEQISERIMSLARKTPRLYVHQINNEMCTGDYVYNSKHSLHCFDVKKMEDCMYCNNSVENLDCLDSSNCYYKMELNYEIMAAMELYNCNFCVACFYCRDLDYCENVHNSKNCFGCFSMNHAEYCIFNEKYSPEDYEKKVQEIKAEMKKSGEWGQHLSSAYKYEDSNAAMYWPEK